MSDLKAKFIPQDKHPAIRSLVANFVAWQDKRSQFISLFHDEARVRMVGDRIDGPFFGLHRGHEQILRFLRNWNAEIDMRQARLLSTVIECENFAIRQLVEARHHGTGEQALMLLGHMARTRGGLIDELVVYGDTALISRMIAR